MVKCKYQKKTAWNIFRVWMGQWLIYFPKSWRLAANANHKLPPEIYHGTWKWWFPKGITFSRDFFSGSMLNFRGVFILAYWYEHEYKLCLNCWIWRCHSRELGKNGSFPDMFWFSIDSIAASSHVWTCQPSGFWDVGWQKVFSLEVLMAKLQWWR